MYCKKKRFNSFRYRMMFNSISWCFFFFLAVSPSPIWNKLEQAWVNDKIFIFEWTTTFILSYKTKNYSGHFCSHSLNYIDLHSNMLHFTLKTLYSIIDNNQKLVSIIIKTPKSNPGSLKIQAYISAKSC